MIEPGRVVYSFAVVGQLMPEGTVQIMGVKIDTV
jgi:ABC-type transporter Mla subunit MlaD